jgi:CBS domain containing-hemolysin-like protein
VSLASTLFAFGGLVLVGFLCVHAVLTRRVRTLVRETPLVYSRLPLPPEVDLRGVLEQPRYVLRRLTLAGSVLRVGASALFIAAFLSAPGEIPAFIAGLVVFIGLAIPEAIVHLGSRREPTVTVSMARLLRWFGRGADEEPGGAPRAALDDPLRGEILTTIDGREVFDPISRRILGGLIGLKRISLRRVLIPRKDVVLVNETWSVSRAVRELSGHRQARVPVVAGKSDDIVGLAHAKDLLLLYRSRQEGAFVKGIVREIPYVPSNLRVDLILREFQRRRLHLAAVQDEYGKTTGFVTMDAILRHALKGEE